MIDINIICGHRKTFSEDETHSLMPLSTRQILVGAGVDVTAENIKSSLLANSAVKFPSDF